MSSIAAPDATHHTDAAAPTPQGSSKLGKDEFLKLLMAQLGQQDPTSPADSSAFVAQLAQFASLELMQNTNGSLESLLVGQAAAQQTAVINMVGKDVSYRTDQLTLGATGGATAGATLAAAATKVSATITDASGRAVRTMNLGAQGAGAFSVPWDGRDDNGNTVPPGRYTLQVSAVGQDGKPVTVEQSATGRVTGVSFDQGGVPSLNVGSDHIKLSDVVEINERNTP